jgi:hypothetical protein
VGYHPATAGRWFIFFTSQGPLLAAESSLMKWARKRKIQLPHWAAILLTLSFLMAIGDYFFFRPAIETGLADRVVNSLMGTYKSMWEALQHVLQAGMQDL